MLASLIALGSFVPLVVIPDPRAKPCGFSDVWAASYTDCTIRGRLNTPKGLVRSVVTPKRDVIVGCGLPRYPGCTATAITSRRNR